MEIQLAKIDRSDSLLPSLFADYVAEMLNFLDQNDPNTQSVDADQILEKYWQQSPIWPYLILADDEVAGFCLLRHYPKEPGTKDIDQYYITPGFRRRGLGRRCLLKLTQIHPGNWLIRVLKTNTGAFAFWLDAVNHSVNAVCECRDESEHQHFIRFNIQSPPASD